MARVVVLLLLIGGVFGLGACGSASQATTTSAQTPAKATTSVQIPAKATSTPGVNMPTQVKVITDKLQYVSNETLTVTVKNGLSSSIFIASYQTNCTPLLLEGKAADNTWMPKNLCYRAQSASLLQLKPGAEMVYRLTPTFRHPGTTIRSTVWGVGMYRVSISYMLAPDADTVQGGIKVYAQNVMMTQ